MEYVSGELKQAGLATKLVLIPSAREIHHLNPLPQPPYAAEQFPRDMPGPGLVLMGNPQVFRVNEITFGVLNADVVKDLCGSTVTKGDLGSKIDLSVKSILQQRTFYPLYPGNQATPVEWQQHRRMMFPEGVTPDVLIVPS